MTFLQFLNLFAQHDIPSEDDLWALAAQLADQGDKALMAYLGEHDSTVQFAKAVRALGAKEIARRSKLTRMEILQEARERCKCSCSPEGLCYELLKDVVRKNDIDGPLQQKVVGALAAGRMKKRNLCVVGQSNMAKSFLFKPLLKIFKTYEMPDGGSYQLEEILDKEMVFLNDFEYDDAAKKWMAWSYFKRFLEGGEIPVARPKNRGGNTTFQKDAPVFFTAPQEIQLWRGKRMDLYETEQMRNRITYVNLHHVFEEADRQEAEPCAACGAWFYLESCYPPPSRELATPQAKRARTVQSAVEELKELKNLLESNVIDLSEFQRLKGLLMAELP